MRGENPFSIVAEVVASFQDRYWHFPAITRNRFGKGALTYEGIYLSDALQGELIRDVLKRAGLNNPDESLPSAVRVRHGRSRQGKLLHYYFNFSGEEQQAPYSYSGGSDLLTGNGVRQGESLKLAPWDLAIIIER